ncbi:MAG TPA: hypothetical protein EYH06_08855 [Chromatiales bacterium]|nr:hypothetical protein [Thiotrichales bacterium]HIP68684.1 hypothetical protein [Chromatiales bacterium]
MKKVLTTLFVVLFSQFAYAADLENALSNNLVDELFATLPGSWHGRAIETPVGPIEYAMNFHECVVAVVAGVADTGASLHFWRFWKSDGELRLTFLSTFRGNQKPTQLVANQFEENMIWFFAPELALLTLSITMNEAAINIHVFHHQKPHVFIRLTRTDKSMSESEREESEKKSCKKL